MISQSSVPTLLWKTKIYQCVKHLQSFCTIFVLVMKPLNYTVLKPENAS